MDLTFTDAHADLDLTKFEVNWIMLLNRRESHGLYLGGTPCSPLCVKLVAAGVQYNSTQFYSSWFMVVSSKFQVTRFILSASPSLDQLDYSPNRVTEEERGALQIQ